MQYLFLLYRSVKPDQRTKNWLVQRGYVPWRTEVYHPYAHKKYDLFWICDYVALLLGVPGLTGYQICGEDLVSHLLELQTDPLKAPMLKLWLCCNNFFEVHSWVLRGPRGKRKFWVLRRYRAFLTPSGEINFEALGNV